MYWDARAVDGRLSAQDVRLAQLEIAVSALVKDFYNDESVAKAENIPGKFLVFDGGIPEDPEVKRLKKENEDLRAACDRHLQNINRLNDQIESMADRWDAVRTSLGLTFGLSEPDEEE